MNTSLKAFKCIKCGECCRAGYNVYIQKIDIEKWKKIERNELLEHIIINPKCIAINDNIEFNSVRGTTLAKIRANKNYRDYNGKFNLLIRFIQKNHRYYGKNPSYLDIWTIIPNQESDPIYIPKDFETILNGLELGLEYILHSDAFGRCPFLKLNLCLIHEIKPLACKKFPYTKEQCLRNDDIYLLICRCLEKVKERKP
ncbi:MAG: hypothetical protein KGD66_03750 [Candidatus Lokiarchaeota archaeon]|nr:hypothetical protein [Candidatus Lokiarchaeota archaeon]